MMARDEITKRLFEEVTKQIGEAKISIVELLDAMENFVALAERTGICDNDPPEYLEAVRILKKEGRRQ